MLSALYKALAICLQSYRVDVIVHHDTVEAATLYWARLHRRRGFGELPVPLKDCRGFDFIVVCCRCCQLSFICKELLTYSKGPASTPSSVDSLASLVHRRVHTHMLLRPTSLFPILRCLAPTRTRRLCVAQTLRAPRRTAMASSGPFAAARGS